MVDAGDCNGTGEMRLMDTGVMSMRLQWWM